MPLANAVKCWECGGKGRYPSILIRLHSTTERCFRCRGSGAVCSDCHKPEGVCECVAGELCETCGKLACRCG